MKSSVRGKGDNCAAIDAVMPNAPHNLHCLPYALVRHMRLAKKNAICRDSI